MTTPPRKYNFFATNPDEIFRQERRGWLRAVTACVLGTISRTSPGKVLRATWPDDDRAAFVLKTSTTPTVLADYAATTPTWELPLLAPDSAALKLFDSALVVDLTGLPSIRIPSISAWPSVAFVEEGQPAPAKQFAFGSGVTLGPLKKILVLAGVTRELESATPATATKIIGRVLAAAIEKQLDATAFGTGAGDTATPAGLLHSVSPITAASGGGAGALAADVAALSAAMVTANVDPAEMILVASAAEATKIKLLAGPRFDLRVLSTTGLPAKTLAAFAPNGIACAHEGPPSIETSNQTSLVYADPGAAALTASTQNVFQQDGIAIRVRAQAAWAVVVAGAAQVISNVTW